MVFRTISVDLLPSFIVGGHDARGYLGDSASAGAVRRPPQMKAPNFTEDEVKYRASRRIFMKDKLNDHARERFQLELVKAINATLDELGEIGVVRREEMPFADVYEGDRLRERHTGVPAKGDLDSIYVWDKKRRGE